MNSHDIYLLLTQYYMNSHDVYLLLTQYCVGSHGLKLIHFENMPVYNNFPYDCPKASILSAHSWLEC